MGRTPQQRRARERAATILEAITQAARAGLPCPTNDELGARAGYTRSGAFSALERMADTGVIRITALSSGTRGGRIVSIVALGIETSDEQAHSSRTPVREIIGTIAKVAGLLPSDIVNSARNALYKRPRFLICHFARGEGWSYEQIGKVLQRDHSTVIHACRRTQVLLARDPLFARLHRRAEAALRGERETRVPFVPAKVTPRRASTTKMEIGDDGELQPVERESRIPFDPLLSALRAAHPERFAA